MLGALQSASQGCREVGIPEPLKPPPPPNHPGPNPKAPNPKSEVGLGEALNKKKRHK